MTPNEDDDSTIRNLKLVPLPPLTDKEAVDRVIGESLTDVSTRTVKVGEITDSLMADLNNLLSTIVPNGLWIRRVRVGIVSESEQERQARTFGVYRMVVPSLSITFQNVDGHEYNISYGPIPPKTSDRFVLYEQVGILYETDEGVSYNPPKILYEGKSRKRVEAAIRKLGKPGMQAVLME